MKKQNGDAMKKNVKELRTTGWRKLRPGRIHLRCPGCGRKKSNVLRWPFEPPSAFLVETWCDKHPGGKEYGAEYFDDRGNVVEPREVQP